MKAEYGGNSIINIYSDAYTVNVGTVYLNNGLCFQGQSRCTFHYEYDYGAFPAGSNIKVVYNINAQGSIRSRYSSKFTITLVITYYESSNDTYYIGNTKVYRSMPYMVNETSTENCFYEVSIDNKAVASISVIIEYSGNNDNIVVLQDLSIYRELSNDEITNRGIQSFIDSGGIPMPDPDSGDSSAYFPPIDLEDLESGVWTNPKGKQINIKNFHGYSAMWVEQVDDKDAVIETLAMIPSPGGLDDSLFELDNYVSKTEGEYDMEDEALQKIFDQLDDYTEQGTNKNDNLAIESYITEREDDPNFKPELLEKLNDYIGNQEDSSTSEGSDGSDA